MYLLNLSKGVFIVQSLLLLAQTTTETSSAELDPAVSLFILVALGLVSLILIAANWMIYSKAGQPGIASIIPIWNIIALLAICNRPMWWFLLLFIPGINFIVSIVLAFDLATVFGRGFMFSLGLLFPLTAPFFYIALGFGDYEYVG